MMICAPMRTLLVSCSVVAVKFVASGHAMRSSSYSAWRGLALGGGRASAAPLACVCVCASLLPTRYTLHATARYDSRQPHTPHSAQRKTVNCAHIRRLYIYVS